MSRGDHDSEIESIVQRQAQIFTLPVRSPGLGRGGGPATLYSILYSVQSSNNVLCFLLEINNSDLCPSKGWTYNFVSCGVGQILLVP